MNSKLCVRILAGTIFLSLTLMQAACTAPRPPAPPPIVVLDTDQDGINDSLDLCPATVAGLTVNEKGCSVVTDKDHDGVEDGLDSCPNTAARTAVDPWGCPVVVLPEPALTFSLEYQPNGSAAPITFTTIMEIIAEFIKTNPGRRFIIEGHTDSIGNDASNMKLSIQRAEKIKDYLVEKKGVSASLLESRGFGETNPVADNNTQAGRQQNRRVVIVGIPQ